MSLARSCLALALLVCTPSSAQEQVAVIVATRPLAAGDKITFDDVAQRRFPAAIATSSVVTPDNASYIIDRRLLHPVDAGEPLTWASFAVAGPARAERCPAERPKVRPFPPRPAKAPEVAVVLSAARDIEEGHTLTREDLTKVTLRGALATRYAVRWDEATLAIGQRTLVPLMKNDVVRFTQLAAWEDPRRCELQFEASGNLWAQTGPPAAKKVRCPKGTRRVEGVPGGAQKWVPTLPGWVVACLDDKGNNQGPLVAFDRLSDKVVQRGTYRDGHRDGVWEGRRDEEVTTWKRGVLNGPAAFSKEKGSFVDGRREGLFVGLDGYARAEFKGGHLHGAWKTAAGFEVTLERSAAPATKGPVVEVLVAARDLVAGEPITEEALATRAYPAPLIGRAFIPPDNRSYLIKKRSSVATPKGAPLLWSDFDVSAPPPNPVTAPAKKQATRR